MQSSTGTRRFAGIFVISLFLVSCHNHRDSEDADHSDAPSPVPQTAASRAAADTVSMLPGAQMDGRAIGSEEYGRIVESDFLAAASNPQSTFSIDVDAASYSNVRRYINGGSLPPADAVRIEELVNYFTYDYPQPDNDDPFSITTESASSLWNSSHQIIQIGVQGRSIESKNLPPNNLTLLLDVSGSMNEPNKLPLLKDALRLMIDQMRPQDHISIVVYAGAAGMVLPPTSGSDKGRITEALDRLDAGGATAGGEGIQLAYALAMQNFDKYGNNRVILATDGDFNVGMSNDNDLVNLIELKRKSGVFLSVLGFGSGNLKDTRMEQLADKGNGNYAYIDDIGEAKKVLVTQIGGTLFTIAKDVKIQVDFNPAFVKSYRLIGYENRALRREDFANDAKDAGELGAGHTVTALYEIEPAEGGTKADPSMSRDELMRVNLRYKDPQGTTSKLIVRRIPYSVRTIESASNNLKFASAVAGWGMLLRDSKYKGSLRFDDILALARASKGEDPHGYRSEFIGLVETSRKMKERTIASVE